MISALVMTRAFQLLPFGLFLFVVSPTSSAESIWREGEDANQTNVIKHGWYNDLNAEELSGGSWLGHFGNREATAEYEFKIDVASEYSVWARVNPTGATLSFAWASEPWEPVGVEQTQHRVNVARDGGVDLRFVGWVLLGKRELSSGDHRLRFRFHSKNQNHGAIDAIYLTDDGRQPIGKGDPAIESTKHDPGFFAWAPPVDPLNDDCPIDLRGLNELVAGESGFVQRDGDRFVTGDQQTVRFWAVQNGLGNDPSQYDRRARRLAKYGVNLVRMGSGDFFRRWRSDKGEFKRMVADLHLQVAALKANGIYTYLDHLYWHTHHVIDESVFPGFGDGKNAIALVFFENSFQDLYRDFLIDLMQTPTDSMPGGMMKEPGVAFLEIQNESSLLFYTFNPSNFPETELQIVETAFGRWLVKKYGTLVAAEKAWASSKRADGRTQDARAGNPTADDFDDGRVGLYPAGTLSGEEWAIRQRNELRASDQLAFMVESQLDFYKKMRQSLRAFGIEQLIVPSNWKTADPRVLDGLERYTYTAGDVVCRNSYFSTTYSKGGEQKFYAVEVGDTYQDRSSLKSPNSPAPLGTPLLEGIPFMVTENNWTRPNRYRAEWPWLVASYGSLQGIDGWTFFAMGETDWRHSMAVWDLANPSVLGQFPAAALVYRRGDISTPKDAVIRETVSMSEVLSLKGTRTVPLRDSDALWRARIGDQEGPSSSDTQSGVDPLAYFIGPVTQRFASGAGRLDSIDTAEFSDVQSKTVKSVTDEIHWNAQVGVVRLNTPKAQGAWGFLKDAGRIVLDDFAFESGNDYGSIVAVSLDDEPLSSSNKILIQAATWDQPYGFETTNADRFRRITNLGGFPLNVKEIQTRVFLKRQASNATVLDGNGYPTDRLIKPKASGRALSFELPKDSLYVLVE